MDSLVALGQWILFRTIGGPALVSGVIFVIATAIKRIWPRAPNPMGPALLAFVVGIATLPSVPRYQFEWELRKVASLPWVRVENEAYWGDMTEPLTLFWTPVGAATLVMPEALPSRSGFRQLILRYDEKPDESLIEPYCDNFTVHRFRTDGSGPPRLDLWGRQYGNFRYTTKEPQPMDKWERQVYCSDWTKEKQALRVELLKHLPPAP